MSTILCNFALENLAENPSSYDRKIAIPYRAGTIPSSVVQFHWYELQGKASSTINAMMAVTAWNLKKMMRKLKHLFADFWMTLLNDLYQPMLQVVYQR